MKKRNILITLITIVGVLLCSSCQNKENNTSVVALEYDEVIQNYKKVVSGLFSDTFEQDYNNGEFSLPTDDKSLQYKWDSMILDAKDELQDPSPESFGYVFKDFNGDGVDELFLVRKDNRLLAVFGIADDSPKLLDAFWSKNKAIVREDETIIVFSISSAEDFTYSVKKLNTGGDEFVTEKTFGCENGVYFEASNGEKAEISKSEFEKLVSYYPFENSSEWEEIPVNGL